MQYSQHIASKKKVISDLQAASKATEALINKIKDLKNPQDGPYLIFSTCQIFRNRMDEIGSLIERIYDDRVELFKTDLICAHFGARFPSEPDAAFLENFQVGDKLNNNISLSFQMLLIFIAIALDDWARMASHVVGTLNPAKASFDKIAKDDGAGDYSEIFLHHKINIIWLDAFPRLYRNKMITHRERPWQIGNGRTQALLNWEFFTPVAAGWLTEEQSQKLKDDMNKIARDNLLTVHDNLNEQIYILLNNCHILSKETRLGIYKIAQEIGFRTPTFQEIAGRFAAFVAASIPDLVRIASEHPERIKLGGRS